jgi:hypothetical protein
MDMSITSVSGSGLNAATPLPSSNISMKEEKSSELAIAENIDLNKSELSGIMCTPNKAKSSSSPNIKIKSEMKTPPTKKPAKRKLKNCKHKTNDDSKKKLADKYSFVLQNILFEYLEAKADAYGKTLTDL